jgi:hypothetical protein
MVISCDQSNLQHTVYTKTTNQWDAEKSKKADQSGFNKRYFFNLRYQIFLPFPRSIIFAFLDPVKQCRLGP